MFEAQHIVGSLLWARTY